MFVFSGIQTFRASFELHHNGYGEVSKPENIDFRVGRYECQDLGLENEELHKYIQISQ